jgi:sporulation protein YlmC with PRC-barrel domain
MRQYYHELVGKEVVTVDGRSIGRVTDLIAERRGETLRVTNILVGERGLIQRIGSLHFPLLSKTHPYVIPWQGVARVEKQIHLLNKADDIPKRESKPREARSGRGRTA